MPWQLLPQLAMEREPWLCSSCWISVGLGAAASSGTADPTLAPGGNISQLFVLEPNSCVKLLPVLQAGKYGPCFSHMGNIWEIWEYFHMGNSPYGKYGSSEGTPFWSVFLFELLSALSWVFRVNISYLLFCAFVFWSPLERAAHHNHFSIGSCFSQFHGSFAMENISFSQKRIIWGNKHSAAGPDACSKTWVSRFCGMFCLIITEQVSCRVWHQPGIFSYDVL